ncbi:MAG: CpaD family pilus assembly protein [Hyphomicrobiaceae bacterium]
MKVKKSHRARLIAPAGTVVTGLLLTTIAAGLVGCRAGEEPGVQVASWAMIDARQRHPIVVTDQPANLTLRVSAGATGLTPAQRSQALHFFRTYGAGGGASRLAIAVPSGSPNEVAAVRAVADLRAIVRDAGIEEANVTVGPYRAGRDSSAPIKIAYARFVAEAPECGRWPDNLAHDPRNLPYANFGCATQRNLAVQIANPADLLGPRTMTPASAERRDGVYEKYVKGAPTPATKSGDERLQPLAK